MRPFRDWLRKARTVVAKPRPGERGVIWTAVDPGKQGGIAAIWPDGRTQGWFTPVTIVHKKLRGLTPGGKARRSSKTSYNARGMFEILHRLKQQEKLGYSVRFVIEDQHGFSSDSKKAVMSVGVGFGRWLQTMELLGIDYIRVSPSYWKPYCLHKGADKEASRRLAMRIFPKADLHLKKHECQAEALLLADFQRRREAGSGFLRTPPKRKQKAKEKVPEKDRLKKRRKATVLAARPKQLSRPA